MSGPEAEQIVIVGGGPAAHAAACSYREAGGTGAVTILAREDDAAWAVAPGFWSTIGEQTLKYAGWGDGWEESRFEPGADGAFVCRHGRDGKLVGVVAHRDDAAYERGRAQIEAGAPWS